MIDRLFRDHPSSVDETYLEHLHTAGWFGGTMITAGIACLIHAILPCLFVRTGSKTIERLHDRMIVNRARAPSPPESDVLPHRQHL